MPGFESTDLTKAWHRYKTAGEHIRPGFQSLFNPGAEAKAIAKAEDAIGHPFGQQLRNLLSLNDGQPHGNGFLLPGWELFSAARIADEWKIWADLRTTEFVPYGYTCEPEHMAIRRDEWWREKWIPFCGDGGGNHLCIDMDPQYEWANGQIISFWHDAGNRDRVAHDLTDLIELIADNLESGTLHWDDEWGGIYQRFEDDEES